MVDQVAAVLDALTDAKETTRQRVIRLVERLALRIDKVESENSRLRCECGDLRRQLDERRTEEVSKANTLSHSSLMVRTICSS